MIKEAKKLGLLTTPYCFNPDEAERMAEVGADVIVGEHIYTYHKSFHGRKQNLQNNSTYGTNNERMRVG
jgi:predicted TIM-barrel enzyme